MRPVACPAALFGAAAAAGMVALYPGWRPALRSICVPASAASTAGAAPAVLPPLSPHRSTFLLFRSESSRLERQFVAGLQRGRPARGDLRVVLLPSLDAPLARRFSLRETPTLLALDPQGREISRRTGPQAIAAALSAPAPAGAGAPLPPAATCRVGGGPRLRWVEESDPRARQVYRRLGGGRWAVPDIFKAMSLRPDLMEPLLDLSEQGHFSPGYLDRKTKERIATYVSALNGSHYCTGSHAGGLRDLGAPSTQVAALASGELEGASLSLHQRALFEFIRRLTLKPGEVMDADVQRLKASGWRDEQIFEAAFDASLFALFNRVAVTYGLDYPPDGWTPPGRPLPAISHPTAGSQLSRVAPVSPAPEP